MRFGLFVEGANTTSLRGWDALAELWRTLCSRIAPEVDSVVVHGFSKAQIVAMANNPSIKLTTRIPLDAHIAARYEKENFDVLVVAFDAAPPNQALIPNNCLRRESNFVLTAFAESRVLPQRFVAYSRTLLRKYAQRPRQPRGPGRPPRGAVDILYMDPMFEALIVSDEVAIRDSFGMDRFPKDWPDLTGDPSQALARVVTFGKRSPKAALPKYLARGDAKSRKHDFALEIVRNAADDSALWNQEIAQRLAEILA